MLNDGARFCSNCGVRVSATDSSASSPAAAPADAAAPTAPSMGVIAASAAAAETGAGAPASTTTPRPGASDAGVASSAGANLASAFPDLGEPEYDSSDDPSTNEVAVVSAPPSRFGQPGAGAAADAGESIVDAVVHEDTTSPISAINRQSQSVVDAAEPRLDGLVSDVVPGDAAGDDALAGEVAEGDAVAGEAVASDALMAGASLGGAIEDSAPEAAVGGGTAAREAGSPWYSVVLTDGDTQTSGSADSGSADLGGADLGGADLGGADLGGAELGDADLGGADLGTVDLGGAESGAADLGTVDSGGPAPEAAALGAVEAAGMGESASADLSSGPLPDGPDMEVTTDVPVVAEEAVDPISVEGTTAESAPTDSGPTGAERFAPVTGESVRPWGSAPVAAAEPFPGQDPSAPASHELAAPSDEDTPSSAASLGAAGLGAAGAVAAGLSAADSSSPTPSSPDSGGAGWDAPNSSSSAAAASGDGSASVTDAASALPPSGAAGDAFAGGATLGGFAGQGAARADAFDRSVESLPGTPVTESTQQVPTTPASAVPGMSSSSATSAGSIPPAPPIGSASPTQSMAPVTPAAPIPPVNWSDPVAPASTSLDQPTSKKRTSGGAGFGGLLVLLGGAAMIAGSFLLWAKAALDGGVRELRGFENAVGDPWGGYGTASIGGLLVLLSFGYFAGKRRGRVSLFVKVLTYLTALGGVGFMIYLLVDLAHQKVPAKAQIGMWVVLGGAIAAFLGSLFGRTSKRKAAQAEALRTGGTVNSGGIPMQQSSR